jgi:hypothetical protein
MKAIKRVVTATLLVLLTATGLATIAPAPAQAWTQPYGGCDEAWRYPRSAGARDCRADGWIVTRWTTANPRGVVASTREPLRRITNHLPRCRGNDVWRCRMREGSQTLASFRRHRVNYLVYYTTLGDFYAEAWR